MSCWDDASGSFPLIRDSRYVTVCLKFMNDTHEWHFMSVLLMIAAVEGIENEQWVCFLQMSPLVKDTELSVVQSKGEVWPRTTVLNYLLGLQNALIWRKVFTSQHCFVKLKSAGRDLFSGELIWMMPLSEESLWAAVHLTPWKAFALEDIFSLWYFLNHNDTNFWTSLKYVCPRWLKTAQRGSEQCVSAQGVNTSLSLISSFTELCLTGSMNLTNGHRLSLKLLTR